MALSADAIRKTRNRAGASRGNYTVGTSAVVYVGALVSLSTTTGRVHPGTAAAGRRFAGVAVTGGTGNASGTVKVDVEWNCEALVDAAAALTTAYLNANCIIADDNQVTTASASTTTLRVLVGQITQFEGGDAWVWLRNFSEAQI